MTIRVRLFLGAALALLLLVVGTGTLPRVAPAGDIPKIDDAFRAETRTWVRKVRDDLAEGLPYLRLYAEYIRLPEMVAPGLLADQARIFRDAETDPGSPGALFLAQQVGKRVAADLSVLLERVQCGRIELDGEDTETLRGLVRRLTVDAAELTAKAGQAIFLFEDEHTRRPLDSTGKPTVKRPMRRM